MNKNQLFINNALFFMKVKNNAHARFPVFGFVYINVNRLNSAAYSDIKTIFRKCKHAYVLLKY